MKSFALLVLVSLLTGCSATAWKDTGQPGPWCAPNMRGKVFSRTVNSMGAANSQEEIAIAGKLRVKTSQHVLHRDLDAYFGKCTFFNQWPTHGFVNSSPSYQVPFDLCLVSINPTVIIGVERQNPPVSPVPPAGASIYSDFLMDPIAVRTTIPYHQTAKVVWFSPAVDHDLHHLDLASGEASFTIGKSEQIVVKVDGAQLATLRK